MIMGTLQKTLQYALRRQSHNSEEVMQKYKMEIKVTHNNISPHMALNKLFANYS